MTRGKSAIAAALTLGLALVATPALANESVAPDLVVEIADRTFTAGSWGDGVEFAVTGVPEGASDVSLFVQIDVGDGDPQLTGFRRADAGTDGAFTGTVIPGELPYTAVGDGFPVYSAGVFYTMQLLGQSEPELVYSDLVPLTIVEGMSVVGPETAKVSQLKAGVRLDYSGAAPGETLNGEIWVMNLQTAQWNFVDDYSAHMGEDGTGAGTLTVPGATAGAYYRISAYGEFASAIHYLEAVADPTPVVPAGPTKPERVETGAW